MLATVGIVRSKKGEQCLFGLSESYMGLRREDRSVR